MGAGVLAPVVGWDKHIFPVLDHARREPHCEYLFCCVEVAQDCVAAPCTHEANHFCVDICHKEGHGAAGPN